MISRSLPSDRRTPLVYIALGDSTVYGLGTAVDVLTNQVAHAVLHQPGLVTLSVGPNDLRQGRAP